MKKEDPYFVAQKLFKKKFADANCLLLAGSVLRGESTSYSDLDIVVLYDDLKNAFRESFYFLGWPIEVFVHDLSTLQFFFESDKKRGRPSLASMIFEGEVLPKITPLSNRAKSIATQLLEQGPDILNSESITHIRYSITDLIDDLREPRSREEALASASTLYTALADFHLRVNNQWSADGKTIPRKLKKYDPPFFTLFNDAFESLYSKNSTHKIINLAELILAPAGGFLFDGLKLNAPTTSRA